MPGFLLNASSMVTCAHGGMAKATVLYPKVLVKGQPAILVTGPFQVAGCAMPPPPAGNGPCLMGQFMVGSTKVLANGLPLLLQSSQGICAPTGTPLIIGVTQTFVSAM
jgi:hypothetical protein